VRFSCARFSLIYVLATVTQYANGFSTSVAGAAKTSSGTTTEFSSTAFSILPPYALINYIMKYKFK
jgi:hypothetical protein